MSFEALQAMDARCPWFYTACFALLGAAIGSFLNVCIYRIPKGESVVRPGSHCACGKPIPWYCNIPILSWFFLRGRAVCCGKRFSFRYPLVELLTAALFALCWHILPWQQAIPGMFFAAFLVVLSFMDLDTMLLPDVLNVSFALTGVFLSLALPGLHGFGLGDAATGGALIWFINIFGSFGDSLAGMCVGAGMVYWVRLLASTLAGREAMGEGDVILAGGIGAFCGWQGAVFSLLGGAVAGCIVLLPLLFVKKIFSKKVQNTERAERAASLASCEGDEAAEDFVAAGNGVMDMEVPFGPWLAVGAMAWFLYFRFPLARTLESLRIGLAG
jgi:leader peptidase (prepilin peptidase)/N-methyltransferase